jgi:hypothetical protein
MTTVYGGGCWMGTGVGDGVGTGVGDGVIGGIVITGPTMETGVPVTVVAAVGDRVDAEVVPSSSEHPVTVSARTRGITRATSRRMRTG